VALIRCPECGELDWGLLTWDRIDASLARGLEDGSAALLTSTETDVPSASLAAPIGADEEKPWADWGCTRCGYSADELGENRPCAECSTQALLLVNNDGRFWLCPECAWWLDADAS
jgi:hypothetical protein